MLIIRYNGVENLAWSWFLLQGLRYSTVASKMCYSMSEKKKGKKSIKWATHQHEISNSIVTLTLEPKASWILKTTNYLNYQLSVFA